MNWIAYWTELVRNGYDINKVPSKYRDAVKAELG